MDIEKSIPLLPVLTIYNQWLSSRTVPTPPPNQLYQTGYSTHYVVVVVVVVVAA